METILSTYSAEITDTYGGEANYSWVRRATFQAPRDAGDTQLVRLGKKALGITGVRCVRYSWGDTIQLDIVGAALRAFITYQEPEEQA